MGILEIIKGRCSVRKYADKPIPPEALEKIIEAGIWGPSVPSFLRVQPWKFVVVTDKKTIHKVSALLLEKSKKSPAGVNILLKSAAGIIGGCRALIAVYNTHEIEKRKDKLKELYANFRKVIKNAQLSAISAAIQNMILTAESLGIGSCWLDMPLYCSERINSLLKCSDDLFACLTLGYPAEKGRRAARKPFSESVRFIQ